MRRHLPLEERFALLTARGDEDDCWEWQGTRTASGLGYGRVQVAGRRVVAHRLAFEIAHGPIPEGMLVLHRCDNPPCVNPDHLFLGSAKDNTQDALAKGRRPQNGRAS